MEVFIKFFFDLGPKKLRLLLLCLGGKGGFWLLFFLTGNWTARKVCPGYRRVRRTFVLDNSLVCNFIKIEIFWRTSRIFSRSSQRLSILRNTRCNTQILLTLAVSKSFISFSFYGRTAQVSKWRYLISFPKQNSFISPPHVNFSSHILLRFWPHYKIFAVFNEIPHRPTG